MFKFEPGVILWTWLSFLFVLFFIQRYVYPQVRKILDERRAALEQNFKIAEEKRLQAEKALAEIETSQHRAKLEVYDIQNEARIQAKLYVKEQEQKALAAYQELLSQKTADLKRIEAEFFKESAQKQENLIIQLCQKIIGSELTTEQKNKIIDLRIQELESWTKRD